MSFTKRFRAQFGKPEGFLGRVAGAIMSYRNAKRNRWVVSLLDIQPNDRVLEIGFGPGIAIAEIAKRLTTGRVIGVDHSELMLAQASRRNAEAIASGRVMLVLGTADTLPHFEEQFDKVLSVNSYQFWQSPQQTLRTIVTMMHPGGRIAIAHQPRHAGATDESALIAGTYIVEDLQRAGFADARLQTKFIRPVTVACALGTHQQLT